MYMVSKSTLNIFRSLAEVRPKDFKIAQRICNAINFNLREEDFVSLHTLERENNEDGDIVSSIIIELKNQEIEITILDECYFVTSIFGNDEYQFIREYYYDVKAPISESFGINNGKCYLGIKDEYPSRSITVENEEMSVTRTHIENNYCDIFGNPVTSITIFINDIENDNITQHDEVFYFPEEDSMYHISVANKADKFNYVAGATLKTPRYKLSPDELNQDEKRLFDNVGISANSKSKYPKIFFQTTYLTGDDINRVEINIVKYKSVFGLRITENGETNTYSFPGLPTINITLRDLKLVKNYFLTSFNDQPYIDLITNYLEELILRLSNRLQHDFECIVSYNGDALDYYINEGKDIYNTPGKDLEHRAFDIYCRKNNIEALLKDQVVPDLSIKEGNDQHLSKK